MNTLRMLFAVILTILLVAGCTSSRPLPLEAGFGVITAGQSSASDVLGVLADEGLLHSTNAVSAIRQEAYIKEVGIVKFNEADSVVQRKDYLHRRSAQWGLLTQESLYLVVETVVPEDVLAEPFENEMRKNQAVLQYCHEAMIEDIRPFVEDKQTESLMGLGRTALGMGILKYSEDPRAAATLVDGRGFAFRHPTLGNYHMQLEQPEDDDDVFRVTVEGGDWMGPFKRW